MTKTIEQKTEEVVARLSTNLLSGEWYKHQAFEIINKALQEEREKVENVIAEFGHHGIGCVASILHRQFHGKQEMQLEKPCCDCDQGEKPCTCPCH